MDAIDGVTVYEDMGGKLVVWFEHWVKHYYGTTPQKYRDRILSNGAEEEDYEEWYNELWEEFEDWAAFHEKSLRTTITLECD